MFRTVVYRPRSGQRTVRETVGETLQQSGHPSNIQVSNRSVLQKTPLTRSERG